MNRIILMSATVAVLLLPRAVGAQPSFLWQPPYPPNPTPILVAQFSAMPGETVHVYGDLKNTTPYLADFGGLTVNLPPAFNIVNNINIIRGIVMDPWSSHWGNAFDIVVGPTVPRGHYEGYVEIVGAWGPDMHDPYISRAYFTIDVPTPAGIAVTVSNKYRDPISGHIVMQVKVTNTKGETAFGTSLLSVTLGGFAPLGPALPLALGDIPKGTSVTSTIEFDGTIGLPGKASVLSANGVFTTYDGMTGTFGGGVRTVLP